MGTGSAYINYELILQSAMYLSNLQSLILMYSLHALAFTDTEESKSCEGASWLVEMGSRREGAKRKFWTTT